jgi:hypothetical protein
MKTVQPKDFTDITMTATPEVIAHAVATALEADRLVWASEAEPRRDHRMRIRLILRNT